MHGAGAGHVVFLGLLSVCTWLRGDVTFSSGIARGSRIDGRPRMLPNRPCRFHKGRSRRAAIHDRRE